ncbi:MAG: thioredoxin [Clostridia bacterium]|jgi:thioredoxin 1|uniref:Thioredoxin n=1 Tax=Proteiniclasticum aestuarii TaxID=2817862 RepID=A0A939HB13_9CLOT|nr:thioredoxin [Proteiniclasticum aestuarii]MBO1264731.1 thioredoxin [Proteiniclasticum aestuarii]NCC79567.1 thioredoxin [Clostridia bacterium]
MIKAVNGESFEQEVLKNENLVLVDFWAPWCGPCKMLAPLFEELNDEINDVEFVKLNVDENPQQAARYRVASIPTLLAFKNGNIVGQLVGFRPKEEIRAFIEKNK